MGSLSISKVLDVQAGDVWRVLSEFTNVHVYNPKVARTTLITNFNKKVGAIRRCEKAGGRCFVEKVIDWREGRGYTLELLESPLPIKNGISEIDVRPVAGGNSEVTMKISYETEWGVAGTLADMLFLRRMMIAMMDDVTDGLNRVSKALPGIVNPMKDVPLRATG